MSVVIQVENLSKSYRLGLIGGKTLREDLHRWWAKVRGRPDPILKIGQEQESVEAEYIWALRDINFEVKQGEVLGIIGRNGAGKSTLLKILSRITAPTSGEVKVKGRTGSLLEVGTGFHPELTGRENVYLNGAILGMTRQEVDRKFDEIVDFSGVEQYIDTPVKRYSSGMKVRLAFAVAAHLEPEILIIDEVLAVGDAEFQRKCLGKMDEVSRGGRTVLFVSHNMSSVQRLCPRSLLLDRGRVVMGGRTQKVVETYLADREARRNGVNHLGSLTRAEGLGDQTRFTQCIILDAKGRASNQLLFGEPFSIYLEAEAQTELRACSVIVGIDTFEEHRITTIASEDDGELFSISSAKSLHLLMHMGELKLKPGSYLLSLSIRVGTRALDHLPYVLQFEIADVTHHASNPIAQTWGMVHTKASWELLDHRLKKDFVDCTEMADL